MSTYNSVEQTDYKLKLSREEVVFLLVFNSFEIIVGTLSNIFNILVFLFASEMRKRPSDLLIFNLATADLILLTTFQPWLTSIISKKYLEENITSFMKVLTALSNLEVVMQCSL